MDMLSPRIKTFENLKFKISLNILVRKDMLPVYISLTTISKRIHTIYDTILSLFSQTYPIEEIHLYISREAYLLDDGIQVIPSELLKLSQSIPSF